MERSKVLVRRLLPALICLTAASFFAAPVVVAEVVPWLYEVEAPVASQTSEARLAAARVALLELLTRLTGLTNIPRVEAVANALAAPDLYYNQFRFVEVEALDEEGEPTKMLRLSVQFERASVQRLLKDAALPIWRANRPQVVAWVVVEAAGGREILGADDDSELAVALQQRAKQRGLPLVLPLLDLEDQVQVDPAAVWGRLSAVLDPASERYGADIVLVGRLQAVAGGSWADRWEFWIDGELKSVAGQSLEVAELASRGVDFLADELVQRYAVLSRSSQGIGLGVTGVRTPEDYGNLLRYLERFEFVDEVNLASVQGDRVGLVVITRAEPDQLLKMFEVDRRLSEIGTSPAHPSDIEFVWQSR